MNTVLEGRVEQYLLRQCRQHRMLCMKFVSPGRRSVNDRIVIGAHGPVFVELKRPGGKPNPHQHLFHQKLAAYGAQSFVLSTFDEIDAFCLAHSRLELISS